MENKSWLAAYIYYSANLHKFLVDAIHPFKELILSEKLAENYFFIRYWEKGPHIRLRFRGDAYVLQNQVRPKLDAFFKEFFDKYPSVKDKNVYANKKLIEEGLYVPGDSVLFVEYIPEIERYGGEKGMLVSEKQFEMSSDASLSVLLNTDCNDYFGTGYRAIGAALQMHIAGLHAFGFRPADMRVIFSMIFKEWLPAAYRVFFKEETANFTSQQTEYYEKYITEIFDKEALQLEPQMKPFIKNFIEALDNNYLFEENWMNKWYSDMKTVYAELKEAIDRNLIVIPSIYENNYKSSLNDQKHKLGYLMRSYVHMTNNRVGVLNHNEPLVAYLIVRYLEHI